MRAILVLFLFFSVVAKANECPREFQQLDESKDMSQLFRGNAAHYWTWLASNKSLLSGWMPFQGQVLGDPHLNNFGFIVSGDKVLFTATDLDEVGVGPWTGDIARFVLMAEVETKSKVKKKDMLWSYLEGLKGRQPPEGVPASIRSETGMSPEKVRERATEETDRILAESRTKIRRNSDRVDLEPAALARLKPELLGTLALPPFHITQVQDVVKIEKSRGGCPECMRHLVLATGKDQVLIDIKELLGSGVDCSKGLKPSLSRKTKSLQEWVDQLWGGRKARADVVHISGKPSFARPKQWEGFDLSMRNKKEVFVYEAYQLGVIHSKLGDTGAYRARIEKDFDAFHDRVERIVQGYFETVPNGY